MNRIDEILSRIAEDSSKENTATSSSTESAQADPKCPICGGIGFVRLDLPVGDPNFGRLQLCQCRAQAVESLARTRLYKLSNLDSFRSMTFDNFKVEGRLGLGEKQTGSLRVALSQARQYAGDLKGWLVLMGSYGCGKTHLAAAIAQQVVSLGVPTLMLTVPDLLDWLRYGYGREDATFEQRFEEIRNIHFLVLDDLGTQNATPWAEEKLYQIINYRYIHRLPMVVTTNQDMEELDGRVSSRLLDPDLSTSIQISAPDYRAPARESARTPISTLSLHGEQTFGNFSLRENEKLIPEEQKNLEKAFRAASQFADKPKGWLVLMGGYGCGKTHLAAAIGNFCAASGEEPIFQVVPDLLDHLRSTFNPQSPVSYDHLFEQVKTARLLILDDLGTQSATQWAKEKLFQLLNYRYEANLPTVITMSCALKDIDPRIESRMTDTRRCTIYAIMAPSYRGGAVKSRVKKQG